MTTTPQGRDSDTKSEIIMGQKVITATELRSFFKAEANATMVAKVKERFKDAALLEEASRKTNKCFVERWDNTFRKGLGLPLSLFCEPVPIKLLGVGEKRVLVDAEDLAGNVAKKMCIRGPGDTLRVVIPRLWADAATHVPTLHMCSDSGSIGRPAVKWLLYAHDARGTWCRCLT